ncbi:hypothetical protein ACFYYH_05330 [Streptomyces sp. NPDC002018]|uniref:hypothetical protein n=1 Tax=Streptomyces sp. NPDC002018 TaxID=3364629 RepID=UPI0036CBE0F7
MSLRRTRTRSRTLAAVGLLAATGLFLTACEPSGSDAASGAEASADASADAGADAGSGAADGGGASTDNREDGTVTGLLTYMAPGKLEVGGRPFFVAEDTVIQGGEICGDPETPETENCTPDELDMAAKDGGLNAEVTIEKGIAVKVLQKFFSKPPSGEDGAGDQASTDNREDGTVTGLLTFMAPGKLEVGGRPFFVAEDTVIQGGEICGDPETPETENCTPDDLDMAAKNGNLNVKVTIKKGIAERVIQG